MESLTKVALWLVKTIVTVAITLIILEGFGQIVMLLNKLRNKIKTNREFKKIVSTEKA